MDKQQKQIIITSVLIVVLIIAGGNCTSTLKKRFGKKASSSVPAKPLPTTAAPLQEVRQPVPVKSVQEEELDWLRCPFCGIVYSEVLQTETINLRLMGILWDDQKPMAIIGEDVFTTGDKVGKFIITEIKQDRVIVNDGTKDFELKIRQE